MDKWPACTFGVLLKKEIVAKNTMFNQYFCYISWLCDLEQGSQTQIYIRAAFWQNLKQLSKKKCLRGPQKKVKVPLKHIKRQI